MCPTNAHLASLFASAVPARSRSQATSVGCRRRSTAACTASRTLACFVSAQSTVVGHRGHDRAVSRPPLACRLLAMLVYFTVGKHPRLHESSRQLPVVQSVFWTKITVGAAGRCAAFDEVVTLTVRTADGDARHGPCLPMTRDEEEAPCAMHRRPSLLLKHSLPPDAFQEYAAHPAKWSAALHAKGSERPCIRSSRATCLRCACAAHSEDGVALWVSITTSAPRASST